MLGAASILLLTFYNNKKKVKQLTLNLNFFVSVVLGPSELDNFTDNLRGVIPRSFEYLFFLINREVERVSCNILSA